MSASITATELPALSVAYSVRPSGEKASPAGTAWLLKRSRSVFSAEPFASSVAMAIESSARAEVSQTQSSRVPGRNARPAYDVA